MPQGGSIPLEWDDFIDMLLLVDTSGKIVAANNSFYDGVEISQEDEAELNFLDFVHPDDTQDITDHILEKLRHEDEVRGFEFRLVKKDGSSFEVECNAKSIVKENKQTDIQIVIRDITGRKVHERDTAKATTILGLAKLAEYRDEDTGAHLERMQEYSRVLAEELAQNNPKYQGYISAEYVEDLIQSAVLHDIGKVGISDTILLKPGKLTKEEFETMKQHSQLGGDVIDAIESQIEGQSFLSIGKQIAYFHHEKWDGTGYWKGLKGEEIPLSARITAIADVYDAITSKRVYKEAFSREQAREIILDGRGVFFDPDLVDAFLAREEDLNRIRKELKASLTIKKESKQNNDE